MNINAGHRPCMVMSMSKKGILLVGVLIFGLAALVQFTFNLVNIGGEDIRMVNTGHGVTYAFDANPSFYSNGSRNFYFALRTGIRLVPSGGGAYRWQESFSFTRPHMAARGDVVAVGELGQGRKIYVYNADGNMYSVDLNHPVTGFSVNAAGYLSVITQVDGGFHIRVFNQHNNSSHMWEWRSYHVNYPLRFPVAAELSGDGRYIAIAYWNADGTQLATDVQFWETDNREVRFGTDGLFAGEFIEEAFIAMRFMANNRLLLITDSRIMLYSVSISGVEEVWSKPLYNRIDQLAFYGNNRFAFAAGAPLRPDGRYADPLGTVNIFDLNGSTGRFYLGRRATHLTMGHSAVIVGSDRYFHAISARGTSLWYHRTLHDVRDMIFLDNTDTVLIAGANRAYVWRRQRVREQREVLADS